jgi:mono/diheme cytochrome c family protein
MKKIYFVLIVFIFGVFLVMESCKHEPDELPVPGGGNGGGNGGGTECDTLNITYPGTVYPLLEQYCLSCHSGTSPEAGLDFTDYNTVAFLAENGTLMGVIKHEPGYTEMPPSGLILPDCEISQLEIWIRDTTFSAPPGGIPCDPDTVYFENTILPLLQSSCGVIGCHDQETATERVILTDYSSIMNTAEVVPFNPRESKLYKVMIEQNPRDVMPPPPRSPLTAEQKAAVFNWIAQGAKNNYCDEEECDTINITFSSTVWPIVQNHCFGCHSGTNPSGGISLDNYNNVAAMANNGSLMGTIRHESGYSPMPKNGMQLSDCKITQIQKWIDNGTPNN